MRSCVLALFLLAPRLAAASAQELYGVAPRDVAMAGAATALGDHYGATYYDPAALADAPRLRFSFLWFQADSDLKIDGERAPGVEPARATSMGMVLPLPLKGAMQDRLALGVVLHSPTERLIRVYSRPATEPQFVILQNHSEILGLYLGASARIGKGFSAGFGARLAANVRAQVEIIGTARALDTTSNGFLTTTATPVFAARWAPKDSPWRVALVYRHRFQQIFATPAENNLGGLRTPTPGVKATTLYVPTQVVLGSAWEPKAWTVALDLAYKRWSEYPDPTVELGRIATSTAPFPTFKDTVTMRAGVERRLETKHGQLALRGGAGFEPTPAPEMNDDYNLFDNDRILVGLGAGFAVPWHQGRIRVDAGGQLHMLSARKHVKDAAAVPPGTTLEHETSGNVSVATLGVTWEY